MKIAHNAVVDNVIQAYNYIILYGPAYYNNETASSASSNVLANFEMIIGIVLS